MTTATSANLGAAAAWRLLSLGFAPPTPDVLDEVRWLAETLLEIEGAAPELEGVLSALGDTRVEDAAAQHAFLFRGTVRVPPYEGSYELDPIRQGRQMADVAAFYRAFGAEAHGPTAERPDFVGCELEFLSFLELRRAEAFADGDGLDILDSLRDSFLTDHAGRWLPTFFAAVVAEAEGDLYPALAAFGMAMLKTELERLGIEPASLPRPPGSSLDADTLECSADAGSLPRPTTTS
jgi:TorA maturation chaperone TorD